MKQLTVQGKAFSCSVLPKHLKEKAGSGSSSTTAITYEECSTRGENTPPQLLKSAQTALAPSFTEDYYYVSNLTKGLMSLCAAICHNRVTEFVLNGALK